MVAAVVSGTGVVSGAGTVVGDRIVAIAVMCSVVKCSGRLKYRNTFFCQYFFVVRLLSCEVGDVFA